MKNIKDIDLKNKRVIIRCDLNVPMSSGTISDSNRIIKCLNTLKYLLSNNCKIIILSHFGRIKHEEDKEKYSLKIVAKKLSEMMEYPVHFINSCYGNKTKEIVDSYPLKSIIMLENTRFMDLVDKQESHNYSELAKYWASLADIYINDAFGSSHREHASTAGICKYLPSAVGYLVKEEIENLKPLINIDKRPFTIFMGGAKVEDKLPIIKKLLPKCDYLLLGGGILNSFLKAINIEIYDSLVTEDPLIIRELKELYISYENKIILTKNYIVDDNKILDINIEGYKKYLNESNLIFINGTPGVFENDKFKKGTEDLLNYVKTLDAEVIVGGGDTVSAVKKMNLENEYKFVSSGGGATLEYIADGTLKALEWIDK